MNTANEREYQRRRARIAELWDRVVEDGQRFWPGVALEIAKAIARGEERFILDGSKVRQEFVWHPGSDDSSDPSGWKKAEDDPLNYVAAVHRTQLRYGFPVVPHDPQRYALGVMKAREEARWITEQAAEQARDEVTLLGFVAPDLHVEDFLGPSLHDALKAYLAVIAAKPQAADASKATQASQVERLLEHHPDEPLRKLDRRGVQRLLDYWRARPPNRRKPGRTSPKTAMHMMSTLLAALESASYSQAFGWTMPAASRDFDRRVAEDHDERRRRLHRPAKAVFTLEQLAILNRHAGPVDRLLLLLGLNCGFGAAEAGRLTEEDLLLGQPHPFAEQVRYRFKPGQSFIRTVRPKSGVLGEWLLWKQTVEMLRWGIDRAAIVGAERGLIVVRDSGAPLYDQRTRNAQAATANLWARLLKRVRREHDPNFPKLPFGALRDTIADTVRQHYSDELASLVVSHGSPLSDDELLDNYANRPFGRLFEALEALEEHFRPVFEAAPADLFAAPTRRLFAGPSGVTQ